MMRLSSGETAVATSSDTAVNLIANASGVTCRHQVVIINEGSVAGFFSIDGGSTYARLPASSSVTVLIDRAPFAPVVKVKRVSGGSNLANVWGWAN